jgi:predicted ArsR family transcriptional regulator
MSAMHDPKNADLDPIASLAEPVRRRLYEFVVGQGEPVDRDTAAAGAGVARPLAAFHLDRLADAGLLDVTYRRRNGRTGPGAGRPAKFYGRTEGRELQVSLPPRHYDLAAEILAEGVERDAHARPRILEAARDRGAALAAGVSGVATGRARLVRQLEVQGYEPFDAADGAVRLRNCPFHALVADHRELTCSMNLAMLEGLTAGIDDAALEPRADPQPGFCCVAFVPAGAGDDEGAAPAA